MLLRPSDTIALSEHTGNRLEGTLIASSNPITVVAVWEKPKVSTTYRGANCIKTLRDAGIKVPRTLDGTAGSLPIDANVIEEGEVKLAVTTEGPLGHALLVKKVNGQLLSIVEGNHPIGVGRIVPYSVVKGFIGI